MLDAADQPAARHSLRGRLRLPRPGRVGAPDMTVTGAVLIILILGPTARLVLRGDRAIGPLPASGEPTPTQFEPPHPHR